MRIGLYAAGIFSVKGGIERIGSLLSMELTRRGHECVIFHCGGPGPRYPLPEGAPCVDMGFPTTFPSDHARQCLRDAQLDVLCVMDAGPTFGKFLPMCKGTGIPLVFSEHNAPTAIEAGWSRPHRLAALAGADAVHLLCQGFTASLPPFLRTRATVIHNLVPAARPINPQREAASRKHLLTVARLEESAKRLSLLLHAFAGLAEEFPLWDCVLCGQGPHRKMYENIIAGYGLGERIRLMGAVDDADSYYAGAHLFCLPSAYEGFPLALAEAQSHGLPAVGFAVCPGVNEVIVHGQNGLLAEEMTPQSLAAALRPLMENADVRQSMGKRAQDMLHRYEPQKYFDRWEELLCRTAKAKGHTRLDSGEALQDSELHGVFQEILTNPHAEGVKGIREETLKTMAHLVRKNFLPQAICPKPSDMTHTEKTPKLTSVILACRNGVNYLAEAVAGIRRQHLPVEIIVIDDGSTDDTAVLATRLGCAVFSIPHSGLSAARNRGVQEANGAFVLFHDHDDVLREGALAQLHAALAENSELMIVQAMAQDFISPELDATARQGLIPRPHPFYGLLSGAALFRREVFSVLKPFDERAVTSPSLDLFLQAEEMGLPMTKIDCVTVDRRLHAHNMGRHMRQREYQDSAAILRRRLQKS